MNKEEDVFKDRRSSADDQQIFIDDQTDRRQIFDAFDSRPWYLKISYARDLTPS